MLLAGVLFGLVGTFLLGCEHRPSGVVVGVQFDAFRLPLHHSHSPPAPQKKKVALEILLDISRGDYSQSIFAARLIKHLRRLLLLLSTAENQFA